MSSLHKEVAIPPRGLERLNPEIIPQILGLAVGLISLYVLKIGWWSLLAAWLARRPLLNLLLARQRRRLEALQSPVSPRQLPR